MNIRKLFHKCNTELRKLNLDFGLTTTSFVYTVTDDDRLYGEIEIQNYNHMNDRAFDADFFNKVVFIYPDNLINQFSNVYDLIEEFLLTLKKFLLDLREQISKALDYKYNINLKCDFEDMKVKVFIEHKEEGNTFSISTINIAQSMFAYTFYHRDMENPIKTIIEVLSKLSEVVKED